MEERERVCYECTGRLIERKEPCIGCCGRGRTRGERICGLCGGSKKQTVVYCLNPDCILFDPGDRPLEL